MMGKKMKRPSDLRLGCSSVNEAGFYGTDVQWESKVHNEDFHFHPESSQIPLEKAQF